MATSDAQKRAIKKYFSKNNLVDIKCRVSEEEREQYYKQINNLGYSKINQFLRQAIDEKIERETNMKVKK